MFCFKTPKPKKLRKKCLTLLCYVHSHGKPCCVLGSIAWLLKRWILFPNTYRLFKSLQACHDSTEWPWLVYTNSSVKQVMVHSGTVRWSDLFTMLPFEGDASSLALVSHLLLLKPKVSIFESNDIRHIEILVWSCIFYPLKETNVLSILFCCENLSLTKKKKGWKKRSFTY